MYDCHIHMPCRGKDTPEEFLIKTAEAGISGGAVISPLPPGHNRIAGADQRWEHRLETVLEFTSSIPFLPVFWVDPTEADAPKQISRAAERGIRGFKIICVHYYPREILNVLSLIAETGLPVMFHCGILYNVTPAGMYNRPLEFEVLSQVKGLRFSLAHAGWPWTDEYNAVFGEFRWENNNVDAYADITPGTPAIYRREMLKKLCLGGIPGIKKRILWGTDSNTGDYGPGIIKKFLADDRRMLREVIEEAPEYDGEEAVRDLFPLLEKDNMESFFSKKER